VCLHNTSVADTVTVSFTATLSLAKRTFDTTNESQYRLAVSETADVLLVNVLVKEVTERLYRRRLLAPAIDVLTIVSADGAAARDLQNRITFDALSSALAAVGLPLESLSSITLAYPNPPDNDAGKGSDTSDAISSSGSGGPVGVIAGGAVGGFVLVAALCVLLNRTWRKRRGSV